MAGAPVGNKNAQKSKAFHDAMRKVCVQEDYRRIAQGIEVVLDKAAEGERWALELARDTLDGKPKQQVEVSGDEDNPLRLLMSQIAGRSAIEPKSDD